MLDSNIAVIKEFGIKDTIGIGFYEIGLCPYRAMGSRPWAKIENPK
jgi:hypothetical protein